MHTTKFLHYKYFQVGNKNLKLTLVKKKLQIITLTNRQIYTSLVVKAEPSGNPTTSCSASEQSFSMIFRNKHTTSLPFCVSLPLDLSILTYSFLNYCLTAFFHVIMNSIAECG